LRNLGKYKEQNQPKYLGNLDKIAVYHNIRCRRRKGAISGDLNEWWGKKSGKVM
jgi:hypothetical protein